MTFSLRRRPKPSRYEALSVDRQSFDISLVLPSLEHHEVHTPCQNYGETSIPGSAWPNEG
jgi:hypothetical protein